jgi:hypothetical protein
MQRFMKWLEMRFFASAEQPTVRPDVARPPKRAARTAPAPGSAPVAATNDANLVQLEPEVYGRIETAGPGKNVLIRNRFLREDTGTHETLKIVDDSLVETGESAGFDPYNTGKFDRSETWRARTWK